MTDQKKIWSWEISHKWIKNHYYKMEYKWRYQAWHRRYSYAVNETVPQQRRKNEIKTCGATKTTMTKRSVRASAHTRIHFFFSLTFARPPRPPPACLPGHTLTLTHLSRRQWQEEQKLNEKTTLTQRTNAEFVHWKFAFISTKLSSFCGEWGE